MQINGTKPTTIDVSVEEIRRVVGKLAGITGLSVHDDVLMQESFEGEEPHPAPIQSGETIEVIRALDLVFEHIEDRFEKCL